MYAREDDGDDGRQEPEQRAISRDSPGMRGGYGERTNSADDCLGRARALGHPARTRVAASRRMGKNKRRDH